MRLRVQQMGPIIDAITERSDDAISTIAGPSASGKTTRMLALFFALYGTDAAGSNRRTDLLPMVMDGKEWMAASFTAPGGFAIKRAMYKDGSTERWVKLPGSESATKVPSSIAERDVLAQLPKNFQRREWVALVALPFEWERLLNSGNNGLDLRSMLVAMLPGPSAEDIIAEAIPATRPRTEAAATSMRRTLKTKADESKGALDTAIKQWSAAKATPPATGPTPEQVDAARAAIASADAAVAQAADAREAFGRWSAARRQLDDWDTRWESMGAPPSLSETETVDALLAQAQAILQRGERARAEDRNAATQIVQLERTIRDGMASAPPVVPCGGGVVVTPDYGGPEDGLVEVDCSTCPLLAKYGKPFDPEPVRAELAKFRSERERADQVFASIDAELKAINDRIKALKACERYDRELAALGPQPPDPGPRPEVPQVPDVANARKVLANAEADARLQAEHVGRVKRLEAAGAKARAEHDRAQEALAQAEADVTVIREAPTKALAAKMALLGNGPLAFHVVEDGAKATFTATINGRPLLAVMSRGERLIADVDFRRRLRDACGMVDVPIFVDNRQDAAGDLIGAVPAVPNSIVLITTPT